MTTISSTLHMATVIVTQSAPRIQTQQIHYPLPVLAGNVTENEATAVMSCAACGLRISERHLLKAMDSFWHEDCLKCSCCDCRLGEVGSTLYTRANLLLCKRDYLRLFGATGNCAACNKMIPAFEMVMKATNNVYHLECFACQQCNHRFCVGDRFYLCEDKILCEYDYEERKMFSRMQHNTLGQSSSLANLNPIDRQNVQSHNAHLSTSKTAQHNGYGHNGFSTHNVPSTHSIPNSALVQNSSQRGHIRFEQQNGFIQHSAQGQSNVFTQNKQNANTRSNDDASSGYGSPSPTSV